MTDNKYVAFSIVTALLVGATVYLASTLALVFFATRKKRCLK